MSEQSVYLFMREGSSDKVYNLHLRDCGNGLWRTDYENARRGGSLKPKEKIAPMPFDQAKAEFDAVVSKQRRKGYTEDPSGAKFVGSDLAGRVSGLSPQLPTEIKLENVDSILADDHYALQEKKDGENRTLRLQPGGALEGINKKGLLTAVPEAWAQDFRAIGESFVIAGESIGEQFYAFDLLELNGQDLTRRPFIERAALLSRATDFPAGALPGLNVLPTYQGEADKRRMLDEIRDKSGEGVVFKEIHAHHVPGKNSAGLKLKFYEESTLEVLAHNKQRSVQVGAYDDQGSLVPLGSVTIPANTNLPDVGSFIDVVYLYRFEDGCLEQPTFSKHRVDQDRTDAMLSQITRIKFKSQLEYECSEEEGADRPRM